MPRRKARKRSKISFSFVRLTKPLCKSVFRGLFSGKVMRRSFLVIRFQRSLHSLRLHCPECSTTSQGKYLSFIFSVLLTHRRFTAAHVALPPFFLNSKSRRVVVVVSFYLKFMWESSDFYFPPPPWVRIHTTDVRKQSENTWCSWKPLSSS